MVTSEVFYKLVLGYYGNHCNLQHRTMVTTACRRRVHSLYGAACSAPLAPEFYNIIALQHWQRWLLWRFQNTVITEVHLQPRLSVALPGGTSPDLVEWTGSDQRLSAGSPSADWRLTHESMLLKVCLMQEHNRGDVSVVTTSLRIKASPEIWNSSSTTLLLGGGNHIFFCECCHM